MAAEKDKGASRSRTSKKRKVVPVLPWTTIHEPDSPEASSDGGGNVAEWFSGVRFADKTFPPLEDLTRKVDYRLTSRRGVKFLSQINRTIGGYERDLADAKRVASSFKEMLDAKIKELVEKTASFAGAISVEKHRADTLEKEKAESDAKIASLERQRTAFREAQASSAKRVCRETSAKFEARSSKVAGIVESLKGGVTKRMLQLGQVKNNLQFVKELESATSPSLEEEKAELIEEGERLADAFSVYD